MQTLYATQVASISELKKNPTKLINDAHGMPVVILNHNVAAAYLIPAETFEKLMDAVDESELKSIVEQRLSEPFTPVKVALDDL
ncbi:TPA: type II toxin-antitoxin system Phd/YefM family antitoxin [Legionella pneumophila]|jgi:antitoxin StbD|uniref:Antitoxin n=4 Tax=Legionella TaxID=445 RepID=A0AAN5NIL1_LEGPN|nr:MULTISPECIES: type II toxin-antitoxin system prevent-host-death family antitoxin [Legionellaceae]ERH41460.1 antitoxin [Legionella pneumophila str. Leg01/53]ERH42742.1 antitoxin [Legionella pneumophila str. Leg01/11]ERI46781.1 antitoxin [Legionella pneumophila str. Leg01/20]ANN97187.1 antitoxin [Legionella pneumophila]ERB42442.1 antitoxin [Legionella pneumophila str. 121004]